jgi:hypothetical protein
VFIRRLHNSARATDHTKTEKHLRARLPGP